MPTENIVTARQALKKSKFRSSFKLSKQDIAYIERTGIEKVKTHAEDFVRKRLMPAFIKNDGKQTPYKGHPVFKAQHATATCCRSCLFKWHKIPAGRALSETEVIFAKDIIMDWILERV